MEESGGRDDEDDRPLLLRQGGERQEKPRGPRGERRRARALEEEERGQDEDEEERLGVAHGTPGGHGLPDALGLEVTHLVDEPGDVRQDVGHVAEGRPAHRAALAGFGLDNFEAAGDGVHLSSPV